MDTHLNTVAAKIGMTLTKLRPALTYMSPKIRKRIIESKVKPIILYGSPLVLGQPQSVIQRACSIIMRVNKVMFSNVEGLRSSTAICKKLNIDDPRQDLIKSSLKFIHKILENQKPDQIINSLKLPRQKTGKVYLQDGIRSVRNSRSPINASIELFNAIPADFRMIQHKRLKSKLKKVNIQYSLFK